MKKVDVLFFILFPVLSLFIVLFFKVNFLTASILFFAVPSIYLIARKRSLFSKSVIFTFFSATFIFIFFDTLITLDEAWIIPTIFPFKFFGLSSIEDYILQFFWVLLAVLFYEYFLAGEKQEQMFSKKMKHLYTIYIALLLPIIILYLFHSIHVLTIPYAYVYLFMFSIFIPAAFLYSHPNFLKKFCLATAYFFFLAVLFEIAGLSNNYWIFASKHYLGFVELFGYRFPIEELLFWMIFSTPTLLAVYEYFANDRK